MDLAISVPTSGDFGAMLEVDGRAFASTVAPPVADVLERVLDLGRFRIARDGDDVIGLGGSYELELTLPGGATVPMSGVTWVSVAASHRRRGVLRGLMDSLHADALERGEPICGLTASDAGIYERFGYGLATHLRVTSIDARRVQFTDEPPTEPVVRLHHLSAVVDQLTEIRERYRRSTPGAVKRPAGWFDVWAADQADGTMTAAIHPDGYALWTVRPQWNNGHPSHTLDLFDIAAVTPEAHRELWRTALSVDLVGDVTSRASVSTDDALPWLITDPRAVRTVELNDGLWLRPTDPASLFSARSYRIDDALVLSIDGQSFRVTPDGTSATDGPADIETTTAGAGSLLLGCISASELAGGGRLSATSPETIARADAFFGWAPLPHCRTLF